MPFTVVAAAVVVVAVILNPYFQFFVKFSFNISKTIGLNIKLKIGVAYCC
jgi:hypothetical protein